MAIDVTKPPLQFTLNCIANRTFLCCTEISIFTQNYRAVGEILIPAIILTNSCARVCARHIVHSDIQNYILFTELSRKIVFKYFPYNNVLVGVHVSVVVK